MDLHIIRQSDPELAATIEKEMHRQQNNLELIASENIVSKAVRAAQGSVMTNKYAEGYPEKRYYGGCEFVDIEQLHPFFCRLSLEGLYFFKGKLHTAFVRQFLGGLKKGEMFKLHEKSENVATRSTSETVKDLFRFADCKRWCLFRVKWAQTFVIGPGFFQRNIFRYEVHYIAGLFYF